MVDQADARFAAGGAVATISAAITAYLPELGVPAAGLGAVAALAVDRLISARATRRAQIETDILESSLAAGDVRADEFIERIVTNPRVLGAFERVIRASAFADSRAKVRALGRCLGTMVSDEAKIDPELVWLDILERIDRPHLKLLTLIGEGPNVDSFGNPVADPEWLRHASGLGPLMAVPMAVLQSLELVEVVAETPYPYRPGELAHEVLARLRRAADGVEVDW